MNDAIWTYSDGGPPEGIVRYTKDAISFADGMLKITVSEEFTESTYSYAENDTPLDKPLVSGELRTKFNNFRYGRYEARLRAPYPNTGLDDGNFINSLFTFRTPKGQEWQEIDVELHGASTRSLWTNVMYAKNTTSWSSTMQEANLQTLLVDFDSRGEFHVYAFEWTPEEIRWYVDGAPVRTKVDKQGPNLLPIPDKSAKII